MIHATGFMPVVTDLRPRVATFEIKAETPLCFPASAPPPLPPPVPKHRERPDTDSAVDTEDRIKWLSIALIHMADSNSLRLPVPGIAVAIQDLNDNIAWQSVFRT